jgi:hypothetical protein
MGSQRDEAFGIRFALGDDLMAIYKAVGADPLPFTVAMQRPESFSLINYYLVVWRS